MPFITNYNNYKLRNSLFIEEKVDIEGKVYKRPIDIFNRLETNKLLLYQLLLSNYRKAENLLQTNRISLSRNMPLTASYHYFKDCKNLNAPYFKTEISTNSSGEYREEKIEMKNSGVLEVSFNKKVGLIV